MITVVSVTTKGNFDTFLYRNEYHEYNKINMLSSENLTFEQVEDYLNFNKYSYER